MKQSLNSLVNSLRCKILVNAFDLLIHLFLLLFSGRSFNVEICPNGLEADILRELYCLTLKVKIVNSSSKLCNVTDICFGYSANLTYGIVRDSGPQSVARLSQPIYQRMCGAKVNYAVEGKERLNELLKSRFCKETFS